MSNFMSRRKVTLEEACDALGISVDDYNKAERLINEHNFSWVISFDVENHGASMPEKSGVEALFYINKIYERAAAVV